MFLETNSTGLADIHTYRFQYDPTRLHTVLSRTFQPPPKSSRFCLCLALHPKKKKIQKLAYIQTQQFFVKTPKKKKKKSYLVCIYLALPRESVQKLTAHLKPSDSSEQIFTLDTVCLQPAQQSQLQPEHNQSCWLECNILFQFRPQ